MADLTLKLPSEFYKEEIRNNYKISTKMKKVWAVELDLFKQLDQICRKHNITYYADSGTLLGAARHHGFIPWDDDMDFIMYRSEFNKLCHVASEFKYPYFFQTEETDPGSLRCHAQLRNSSTTGILDFEKDIKYPFNQGIFIDIFPLDGVPVNENKRVTFLRKLQYLKGRARSYYDYNDGFKRPIKVTGVRSFLHRILQPEIRIYYRRKQSKYGKKNPYYVKYMKNVIKYDNAETKFVADVAVNNGHSFLHREDIDQPIYLPFEMFKVPAPKNYNRVLRDYYGNWHIMVKGTDVHGGCLFDTEKSYKEYIY